MDYTKQLYLPAAKKIILGFFAKEKNYFWTKKKSC